MFGERKKRYIKKSQDPTQTSWEGRNQNRSPKEKSNRPAKSEKISKAPSSDQDIKSSDEVMLFLISGALSVYYAYQVLNAEFLKVNSIIYIFILAAALILGCSLIFGLVFRAWDKFLSEPQ